MNIGMILDNEFTGDMRVENEVISLTVAGHNVFVLCLNYGAKEPVENFHGATIIRLKLSLFLKNKMKGLDTTFIIPYTRYWAKQIILFLKKHRIEVIHIHDLYLLGAAFKANEQITDKLPIVADLHENYPEALKHYKHTQTFPGKYVVSIPKWEKLEIKWLYKADYIITVIEEAKERYRKLGINAEKITVVANYVNLEKFLAPVINREISEKFMVDFIVLYMGGFDLHRGLEAVIRALPLVEKEIPHIKLVLVGSGKNITDLKALAEKLRVSHLVSYEGWQPPESLPSYIKASDVCVIPHLKTEHTDNTIPHKLFQYMLFEKPVLSSNCNPIVRILNTSGSGIIYSSNDERELAHQLIRLKKSPDLMHRLGKNGKRVVLEKYNWKETAKNLIQLYEKISQNHSRPA